MSSEKDEQFWTTLGVEGHPHPLPLPFSVQKDDSSSSSSSFSLFQSTNLINHHDQAENYREIHVVSDQTHRQYEQPNDVFSLQENSKDQFFDDNHGIPARTQTAPIKWMSSKMRFLRKMTGEEEHVSTMKRPKRRMQRHQCHSLLKREIDTVIRVCSDCNTTKTPLWRGGPQGPKSLCNACGIRQMKARRAVMASAIARKKKACDVDRTIPYKKRYKFTDRKAEHLKLRFNETSSPAVFHSGFPQDEKDAAILLMALSCG